MKIILRSAVMAALLIATACGKDDGPSEMKQAQEQEEQAEKLESTPLEADTVSDNVIIEGSTKNEGTPPTPNEMISLDITGTTNTAFLNEGFYVKLSSDADITGAYIQFKANDGTVSDSYYDVDVVANREARYSDKSVKVFGAKSKKGPSLFAKEGEDFTVDVDFNASIEPGTFCYVVCVYDSEGNISAPSEVCATVESWGGNAEVVGSWNYTKDEDIEGDAIDTELVGEEYCYDEWFYCEDQTKVDYKSCYTTESGNITFNGDGSFTTEFKFLDKSLDREVSKAQCETIIKEQDEAYLSKGFWAYDADNSRLTLVAYEITDTYGDETENEILEPGDGELIFDGKAELEGDALIIIEDDGSFATIEYMYKYYFEKN